MTRVVDGLVWACRAEASPFGFRKKTGRGKGAKANGLRYESALAKELHFIAEHGIWWRFCDKNGPGVCQTDLVIVGKTMVVVLEAKYTYCDAAWVQLESLYKPVISAALALPVLGVQVCKNLLPGVRGVKRELGEALEIARAGGRATWHWRGLGSMIGAVAASHSAKSTTSHESARQSN